MSGGMPMPPGSEGKLAPYWPLEDETSYTRQAAAQMVLARQFEDHRGTTQQRQNYAASDMKGQAAEALARELGMKVAELGAAAATHEMTAGWLTQGHADIVAYKNTLVGAYANYKSQMAAALTQGSIAGVMKVNDQIESQFRQTCDSAKSGYEKARDIIAEGVKAGKTPPMAGPSTTLPSASRENEFAGGGQRMADGAVSPNLFDPSTGGHSTPAQGAGANRPDGTAGSGPAAGSVAGGGTVGSEDSWSVGRPQSGWDQSMGAGGPSAGGGSPAAGLGGMPMGGMPMQPPQMPGGGQTPGSDLAKTGADMVTKLAGTDKGAGGAGVPVTPEQLDKLLAKQGDGGGLGGEKGEGGGPTADGLREKGDKKLNESATSTSGTVNSAAGPGAHPGAPTGPPSPAAPVTTHASAAPSAAPMTELSADETPASQQQRPQDPQYPTAAGTAQSTASMAPFPGPPLAPSLGTYSPGALGAGSAAPAAPVPPPAAPALPTGTVAAGPAVTAVIAPVARSLDVTNYVAFQPDSESEFESRINALDPDYALAHVYLAQLMASMTAAGWPTIAAVAVLAPDDPASAPLYAAATADGLSLVPAGTNVPGRLRLLTELVTDADFVARWSGYEHPAAALAAFATSTLCPADYLLAYLVSSDISDSKAGRYHTCGVPEIVQGAAEQAWLSEQHHGPARPRAALRSTIAPRQAAEALSAFGEVWRITDATDEKTAIANLWADRWEADDHSGPHYVRSLARYWHAEAHTLVSAGNLAEAAYAVSQLARLEP